MPKYRAKEKRLSDFSPRTDNGRTRTVTGGQTDGHGRTTQTNGRTTEGQQRQTDGHGRADKRTDTNKHTTRL